MILQLIALVLEPAAQLRTLPAAALVLEIAAAAMIQPAADAILEPVAAPVVLQLIALVPGPPAVHVGPDIVRQNS